MPSNSSSSGSLGGKLVQCIGGEVTIGDGNGGNGGMIDVNITNEELDVNITNESLAVTVDWENFPKLVTDMEFDCKYEMDDGTCVPIVIQTCSDGTFQFLPCNPDGSLGAAIANPSLKKLKHTEANEPKKTYTEIIRLNGCLEGVQATPFTFTTPGTSISATNGTIGDEYTLTGEWLSWQVIASPATVPNAVFTIDGLAYRINLGTALPNRCNDTPQCEEVNFCAGENAFMEIMVVRCIPET